MNDLAELNALYTQTLEFLRESETLDFKKKEDRQGFVNSLISFGMISQYVLGDNVIPLHVQNTISEMGNKITILTERFVNGG
jgi:hypothetical protein